MGDAKSPLGKHHLLLVSVKVLRWMLTPVGKCLRINRIPEESQSLSPEIFINYEEGK